MRFVALRELFTISSLSRRIDFDGITQREFRRIFVGAQRIAAIATFEVESSPLIEPMSVI